MMPYMIVAQPIWPRIWLVISQTWRNGSRYIGGDKPVHDVVPDEALNDEHEKPDDDERPADVPQGRATDSAREVDGEREHARTRARAARHSAP